MSQSMSLVKSNEMAPRVVTFSVQIGSDGFAIARGVAARLRFRYLDWQITSQAAMHERLHVPPEPSPDFVDRLLSRLSAATVLEEEMPATLIPPRPEILRDALRKLAQKEVRAEMEEVVRELATEGNAVIVGHGSQVVLRDWPGAIKVLVYASLDKRVARFAAEQHSTTEDAVRTVNELDNMRRSFFKGAYGVDWLDASLYDLAINTDYISVGAAVEAIEAAAKAHRFTVVNRVQAQDAVLNRVHARAA